MKILLIAEKIDKNDEMFGYFHGRILDFVPYCEKLSIICLEENEHNIPKNVSVFSLGKEKRQSRLKYALNFYRYIWRERKNYDTVFVHMAPVWVVMGGVVWHILGKKVVLWYSHKFVDWKLRIAEKLASVILTPSENSFRIKSKKVVLCPHTVDLEAFLAISNK
ncbi:MAG: hypothetical protein AAB628_03225 [Patescibacteria group bacterium]